VGVVLILLQDVIASWTDLASCPLLKLCGKQKWNLPCQAEGVKCQSLATGADGTYFVAQESPETYLSTH